MTERLFPDYFKWVFRVEGFGEVGFANLSKFKPWHGSKWPCELKVGETTEGKTPDGPERITRVR